MYYTYYIILCINTGCIISENNTEYSRGTPSGQRSPAVHDWRRTHGLGWRRSRHSTRRHHSTRRSQQWLRSRGSTLRRCTRKCVASSPRRMAAGSALALLAKKHAEQFYENVVYYLHWVQGFAVPRTDVSNLGNCTLF